MVNCKSSSLLIVVTNECLCRSSWTIFGETNLLFNRFILSTKEACLPFGSRQLRNINTTDCEQKTFLSFLFISLLLSSDDVISTSCTNVLRNPENLMAFFPCFSKKKHS